MTGRKRLAMTGRKDSQWREGRNLQREKWKVFFNQNNLLLQKIFKFFQRSHNCLNSQPLKSHFYFLLKTESTKEEEKIVSEIVKIASEKSEKIFSSTYSSFFWSWMLPQPTWYWCYRQIFIWILWPNTKVNV